MMVIDLYYLY